MRFHGGYRADIGARNRSVKMAASVQLLVRLSIAPNQLLHRPQDGFPYLLSVRVTKVEQRVRALRGHQRRLFGAVFPDQHGGGAVDIEVGGHWSAYRARTFFQNHFVSVWFAGAISSLSLAVAVSRSAVASGCAS